MTGVLNRLIHAATDPSRLTDAQLVATFLTDRDEAAFTALVCRHGPMVLAACRRVLRHQQDAEDAFQATFLVLARRAGDVWPREALGSWLYGVASRVAWKARAIRTRRITREQALMAKSVVAEDANPEPDLAEVIDRAMRKLPEVYRAAVVACDLEGLSRKDAAEQLGWKEGTLSGRLARARQLLATRLRKAGLTLPASGIGTAMGTGDVLSAEQIADTVRAILGANGGTSSIGVSAPVAALTEGVVRGMFLAKIKTAVVALLAFGAIGFGMWSSAGAGDGRGGNHRSSTDEAVPTEGKVTEEQPAKPATDLEKFQGSWWILAKVEGGAVKVFDPNTARDPRQFSVAIHGTRFLPPNPGPTQDVSFLDREMKLVLDSTKNPRQFDLVHDAGKLVGIYEFPAPGPKDELILLRLVLTTAGTRPAAFQPRGSGTIELILGRYADPNKDPSSNAGLDPKKVPDLAAAQQRLDFAYQDLQLAVQEFKTRAPAKDLDGFELNLERTKSRVDQINQLIQQSEAEVVKARLRIKPAPRLPTVGNPPPANKEAPQDAPPPEMVPTGPRIELALQELDIMMLELEAQAAKGKIDPALLERVKGRAEAFKTLIAPGEEMLKSPPKVPGMSEELKLLQGKWRLTTRSDGKTSTVLDPNADDPRLLTYEIRGNKILFPYLDASAGFRTEEYSIWRLDPSKNPREIDLISPKGIVAKGIYDFRREGGKIVLGKDGPVGLKWSFARNGRPGEFGKPGEGGLEFTMVRVSDDKPTANPNDMIDAAKAKRAIERQKAELEVELAEKDYEAVIMEFRRAKEKMAVIEVQLAAAKARLAELETVANKPAANVIQITIRVRPVRGPETVSTWNLTSDQSVFDALTSAKQLQKQAAAVDVWIMRPTKTEPEILIVDWTTITARGDTKTNYKLQPGDTIFIQYRLQK